MSRTLRAYRTATALAFAAACSGSEVAPTGSNDNPAKPPPDVGAPGVRIPAGNNMPDTIGARPFAADTTDSTGTAAVVVGFSTLAAAGSVQISVPALGFADTARYTVNAGNVARLTATPPDTQVSVGGTVQVRVSTQDA